MSNANLPFLIKFNTDWIIGAVIRSGTSGDVVKEAANAANVITICNALSVINSGDVTGGLAALEAVAVPANIDPAYGQMIVNAVSFIASKAAAIQQLLSGTIAGATISALNAQVLAEAVAVAQKYIPAAPAAEAKPA